ncbi:MAG: TraR/DksA C4-type zinc finger protein [Desulfosarcinaceae bacterium]|nr:TraR/DksA C4-type zinc finger protein [Desulfosarcinaceae bacterium]
MAFYPKKVGPVNCLRAIDLLLSWAVNGENHRIRGRRNSLDPSVRTADGRSETAKKKRGRQPFQEGVATVIEVTGDMSSSALRPIDIQRRVNMDYRELKHIKQELLDQLEELRSRGRRTVFEISRELSREADLIDRASQESMLSQVTRLRSRESNLMEKIIRALEAIEDGEYGICDACGEDIAVKRLLARPVTTLCIHCKQEMEENERRIGA